MWRKFRAHESYQWIQTCGRHVWRKRKFLLISVILSTCFFGVIILPKYKNDFTNDVKKSDYVLEREKESLAQSTGVIKESNQDTSEEIESANSLMVDDIALLTLFTSWVDRRDKYVVQNRTVENWISFWPHIQPVIFTNDTKLGWQCRQRGWSVLTLKHTALEGVPVVKYMYRDAMHHFNSTFYGYSNSDILFSDGLIKTLVTIREFIKVNRVPVLITGRRTNVDYKLPCNASDWRNITNVSKKGELVSPFSADYFITTKEYPWEEMDEIIIGHILIDNWIIQFSQIKNFIVIDSTPTILALHQTTETGNDEGHSKTNKFYNKDIVRKDRNITINGNKGRTDCADYVTNFTRSERVRLVKQTPQIICKEDTSSQAEKGILHPLLIKCLLCFFVLIIHK